MVLSSVFEKFAKAHPVAVMARALMERALEPEGLDALFRRHAKRQYEKELLFSTMVDVMALVVCRMQPSVKRAYAAMRERIPVSLTALYAKIDGVEVGTSEALVAHSAEQLRPIVEELGAPNEPWLKGYRLKVLDGNHLAATERRLSVLRDCAAGPLPGHALVVMDPETGLVTQIVGCEDGHAQERSLVEAVIAAVQPRDVYVADRNFCTAKVFNGVAERAGFFVIREHAQVAVVSEGSLHARGCSDGGSVFEQGVTLRLDGREVKVRRVVLRLDAATRDGDTEMAILTNLPASVDAVTIAGLYRRRWTIESMFARVERNLHSELASLGYPGAAVFGFAVALVANNIFAVVQSVLKAAQKRHAEKAITEMPLSEFSIVEDIRTVQPGMKVMLDDKQWRPFRSEPVTQFATLLLRWAQYVDWRNFRKAIRGPKVRRERTRFRNTPHVSTAKLLGRA
jgi:Transposase DDE domain